MSILTAVFLIIALLLGSRLAWVQLKWGSELKEVSQLQREREYKDPARRGDIVDREGRYLAYTMKARSLVVSPTRLRDELGEIVRAEMLSEGASKSDIEAQQAARIEDILRQMATKIPEMVAEGEKKYQQPPQADGDLKKKDGSGEKPPAQKIEPAEILEKLHADSEYEVLVRNVDPDVAAEVAQTFHGVAADRQDLRKYPNGAVGENIVGKVGTDGAGQFGLEASSDSVLTGIDGLSYQDVSANGQAIPGTLRDVVPVVDGAKIELTVDLDLQTYVQQELEQARINSKAKGAEAVVLDAKTGEVLAMANTGTIDPNGDLEKQLADGRSFENPSISNPFEPGSVAKIITATGTIEEKLTKPDEVLQVPGSIDMAGVTVRDAWPHDVAPYTTTGVFGKSSNVGTLMLAQRLGEKRFNDYVHRFGIGQTTGIELPNESPGLLPPIEQWSGGTFANLPIGQGMSLTTLQLAGVYQALANGGERIEPRIIKSVTLPTGETVPQEEPKRVRVASEETSRTVLNMFRAPFQEDPNGVNSGTAAGNGIPGYQLSGKTGTAQQVNPETGAYSNSDYWITFAGIAPTNDPRFVVAVMLDDPERGPLEGGAGGQSSAPVFKLIAEWLISRENIPVSPDPGPPLVLEAR
ncbi:peptidoglycan D,D-transpeptidase FtsI family protein [Corynebacterium aquatimens]|uniref:Cell division protein FtsI (Penicillin-binding protein 3) n=1 Tax=Corynebacterium aquatimens TaxID=1190508 RepID=A0A931DZK8_9CORY|nr:penicillin-binding protein 2 [Corynebacterium aquatimens]MBG6121969.1 cell division protein FtsI (penicillin-binding protein 3) [Corynebacterium aquatimens]